MIDQMTIENTKQSLRGELMGQLNEATDGIGREIEFKVTTQRHPGADTVVEGIARDVSGNIVAKAKRTISVLQG